jgi:serine/threonine-protein kinase
MRVIHRGNRLGRDGRYHLERQLGEDALGSLWLAKDVSLGTAVTIRLLRGELVADAPFQRCLRTALRAAARFEHPNVPGVIAAKGTPEGHIQFVVMRAFEGRPLAHRLAAGGPLDAATAERVATQVKGVLDAAHDAGLVHGALGPTNVVLTGRGVRVIDFGIAAALRQAAIRSDARFVDALPTVDAEHEESTADDDRSLERLRRQMQSGRANTDDELSALVIRVVPANGATGHANGSPPDDQSAPASVARPRSVARKPPHLPARARRRTRATHPETAGVQASRAIVSTRGGAASVGRFVRRAPARAVSAIARPVGAMGRRVARSLRTSVSAVARAVGRAARAAGRSTGRWVGSAGRGMAGALRTAGRGMASAARSAGRGMRRSGAWSARSARRAQRSARRAGTTFARGVASTARAVGRRSHRVGTATARGSGSSIRALRGVATATRTSTARGTGSALRAVRAVGGRAGASIVRAGGDVGRTARRAGAATGRTAGRAGRGTAAAVARSARAGRRWVAAIGGRRLAAGAAVAVVIAASIAGIVAQGSSDRRPSSAAPPAAAAPASPAAEPTPTPAETPSPAPQTTSGLVVPDVLGLSALDARRLLERSGLEVAASEPAPGPPGEVVGTSPRVAELVAPGTRVTLFVGTTSDRLDAV